MINKFRYDLLSNNKEFGLLFNSLLDSKEINEFDDFLWNIIFSDKTPIRINNEPLAFKDLFHLNLNDGRCKTCSFELVFLLDKLGIYSEAVKCVNEAFAGTSGSVYGGHWYVETNVKGSILCIDTSLVVTGSQDGFKKLGHNVIKKYDIDSIFKEEPSLVDYYDNMIIKSYK